MYAVRTHGMGMSGTSQDIDTGVTTAGAIAGAAAQGGLLTAIGIGASAVPVIGLAVLGATVLINAFHIGQGCGSTCTLSTQVVERIIPVMQQNLQAAKDQASQQYGCLTNEQKASLLSNFDQLWNAIVQGCTQVGGAGGSACISDRQRGGKYDCFKDLRDPISAIPLCVNGGTSSGVSSGTLLSSDVAGVPMPLLLAAGLAAFALLGGKN